MENLTFICTYRQRKCQCLFRYILISMCLKQVTMQYLYYILCIHIKI